MAFNISAKALEDAIRETITKETQRAIKEAVTEAQAAVEKQISENLAGLVMRLVRNYDVSLSHDHLVITVHNELEKRK